MGPCGCSIIRDADKEDDEQDAEALRVEGAAIRAEWRCPGACGKAPAEAAPEKLVSLRAAERLTRAKELKTCPRWYASLPWAHRVADVRVWARDYHSSDAIATPTSAFYYAIKEIDAGVSARQQDDDERRERKRDKHG